MESSKVPDTTEVGQFHATDGGINSTSRAPPNMNRPHGQHRRETRSEKKRDDQLFDPSSALEQLHAAIVRLEALSQAVMNTFEFLPRVEDAVERRALEHACGLMMVLDEEIAKAVASAGHTSRLGGTLTAQ